MDFEKDMQHLREELEKIENEFADALIEAQHYLRGAQEVIGKISKDIFERKTNRRGFVLSKKRGCRLTI